MHMASQGWGETNRCFDYTLRALREFSVSPPGISSALPSFCSRWIGAGVNLSKRPMDPGLASMFALFAAVVLFHSTVPAGIEARKLILGLPGLLCFVPAWRIRGVPAS